MKFYHRGWHRIADELEALHRTNSPASEHWFFTRHPRAAEIAAVVSSSRVSATEALPINPADLGEILQDAIQDQARLFDEEFASANQFLDFHLALILREGESFGITAIKPIISDDASIPERVHALGDAFNRFKAAKAHALAKMAEPDAADASSCSFEITIEPETNIACFKLAGSFHGLDVERLIVERDRVFKKLTSRPNRHLTLVDIRDMSLQSFSGFTAFAEMLVQQEPRAMRIAFLIRPNCVSTQAHAAAQGRGGQFFVDEAQAREWLSGYGAPPIPFPSSGHVSKARARK